VQQKRAARQHRGKDRLQRALPAAETLLNAATARGDNLAVLTRSLVGLLEQYGVAQLGVAVAEAIERKVPHANAVRQCVERRRQERALPPPVALDLADGRLQALHRAPPRLERLRRPEGGHRCVMNFGLACMRCACGACSRTSMI
jgi:hypothetical protein